MGPWVSIWSNTLPNEIFIEFPLSMSIQLRPWQATIDSITKTSWWEVNSLIFIIVNKFNWKWSMFIITLNQCRLLCGSSIVPLEIHYPFFYIGSTNKSVNLLYWWLMIRDIIPHPWISYSWPLSSSFPLAVLERRLGVRASCTLHCRLYWGVLLSILRYSSISWSLVW